MLAISTVAGTAMDVLPPRYTSVHPLRSGSFGTVFVAEDSLLRRRVAVKVLAMELTGDATARRRFEREVQTAAALGDHPHVVTIHDAGEWNDRPYLVMELLAGSVAERVAAGPIPEGIALRWLAQAAEALDFVHERGIVHRDVKPANLLLDSQSDLRLSDFGVVRREQTTGELTVIGAVVGTPGYLAPEVAAGGVATPASDRYSLAVVARELLGEREPLVRALAEDPAARYASAGELVSALDKTRHARTPALGPTRIAAPFAPTRVSRPPAKARVRRHRAIRFGRAAVVLAAVAAVSGAAGGYLTSRLSAVLHLGGARHILVAETCAVSPVGHDANIIVNGALANGFCRSQAHVLTLAGGSWSYRQGAELYAPDHGAGALSVVCRLRSAHLKLTVYDSGSRNIGREVCRWYVAGGWHRAAIT